MPEALRITDVRLTAAAERDQWTGLLGYVRIVVNDALVIDGVTLRRTRRGEITLSFPVRYDRGGGQHSIVRPLDAAARADVERQVFAALNLQQETAP